MVEFKKSNKQAVTEAEMQAVYKKISTPRKLGAVIKWEDFYTDSPTVPLATLGYGNGEYTVLLCHDE